MFYIIESGRRITTPVASLLQGPSVAPVQPPRAIAAEPARQRDRLTAAYGDDARQQAVVPRRLLRAQELMSAPVRTATPLDTVTHAWQILLTARCHHLPIVGEFGQLVGIVSDRDLLRAAAHDAADPTDGEGSLAAIMRRSVIVAGPDAELRLLAEVMAVRRIGAVPIVDEQSRPVGIVSRADLLRAIVRAAPVELWG